MKRGRLEVGEASSERGGLHSIRETFPPREVSAGGDLKCERFAVVKACLREVFGMGDVKNRGGL